MLCEHCGKNEANVHITKNINGYVTEMNLCSECARETGNMPDMSIGSIFSDFFSSVMPARAKRISPRTSGLLSEYAGCEDCLEGRSGVITETATEQEQAEHKIEELRKQLRAAVDKEEYEQAAKLRDEIKALENKDQNA